MTLGIENLAVDVTTTSADGTRSRRVNMGSFFHELDLNLQLAITEALCELGIRSRLDKEAFISTLTGQPYDSCADYNYQPLAKVTAQLVADPPPKSELSAIRTLRWSTWATVIHQVWTYWDGESSFFDVRSLA